MSSADDTEIRNIVARLAHLADMATDDELEDYLSLFTEDAEWSMPGAPAKQGHAAIREGAEQRRAEGMQGPGSNSRHVITTQRVEIDGDEAASDAYFLFVTDTTTSPTLRMIGHYSDRFVKENGRWRLARRHITTG